MSRPTASTVVKKAYGELGVYESPANSNKVKYNKWYYGSNVSGSAYPWCAVFLAWVFYKTAGNNVLSDKSASASGIQDSIVNSHGGTWVQKKTTSKATRKKMMSKLKKGDVVTFDFGAYDAVRDHVGIVYSVGTTTCKTIEGNTSVSGSQSNGGMVCLKSRSYTEICAAARPKYGSSSSTSSSSTKKTYSGTFPKLPSRGYFKKGDSGTQVKYLQKFLNWCMSSGLSVDGILGTKTRSAVGKFQKKYSLTVDYLFGKKSLAKAKTVKK